VNINVIPVGRTYMMSKHEELLAIKESKLKDAETQQGVHAGDLEALVA
jgi:hypothetical protein